MSKKALILVVLIILAVSGVLGWYFLFRTSAIPGTGGGGEVNPFPFGQGGGTEEPVDNGSLPDGIGSSTVDLSEIQGNLSLSRLRQISFVPTAGAAAFGSDRTLIRYIERATGHIYETLSDETSVRRVSNVTIPKVYEALWAENGSELLIRYLRDDSETIRTFYAKISASSTPERALEGTFLEDGIRDISVSGNKVFYFVESAGSAQGIVSNLNNTGRTSVFSSPFSDWSSAWSSQNAITLFTRPSGLDQGSAYILNPSTGAYIKALGGINGLAALANSNGTLLIVSESRNNSIDTFGYDISGSARINIGISTLSEKCVWSKKSASVVYCAVPEAIPNGTYPDDWYKGKISFDDSLWKIDAATGVTEEIMNPEIEAGVSMDMIKLSLDPNESIVLFTNKKDMAVWSYELEN